MVDRQPTHTERIKNFEATLEVQHNATNEWLERLEEVLNQLVDQRRNGEAILHKRKASNHKGSMGSRRSQHWQRVEDLASSIGFSSFINESMEDNEMEEEHQWDMRVASRGEATKIKDGLFKVQWR